MGYRPEWFGDEKRGICQIAVDVVSTIRGGMERDSKEQEEDFKKLAYVRDNWKSPTDEFDICVYHLVCEALRMERERRLKERESSCDGGA